MGSIVDLDYEGLHTDDIVCIIQYLDTEEANRYCELYLAVLVVEIRNEVAQADKRIGAAEVEKQNRNELIRLRKKSLNNLRGEIKKAGFRTCRFITF